MALGILLAVAALAAQERLPPVGCDMTQATALVASGRQAVAQKNYEAAAREFRRAFDACPRQRVLLLELAQALTLARKFDEAARAARDFLAAQPDSEQGLVVLANVHFMAQQFPDCQKALQRVLKANGRNLAALKLKANVHYLIGEEQEAEQTFLKVIELDPKGEDAVYSLGRIYYQQNRFQPAIAQFKRVLELNPQSYKAYDNLGLCYEALNQEEEAIRHYIKALDMVYKDHPDYDWPYANLANLLLKRGEYQKAFDLAAEAAQRNPASARNFFLTGKALTRMEKPDVAIEWLKRAAELDANYPEPHYLLGQIYSKQGLKEEAEKAFKVFQEISAKVPRRRR